MIAKIAKIEENILKYIAIERFEYAIGYYRDDLKCFVEKDTRKKLSILAWKHISPPDFK